MISKSSLKKKYIFKMLEISKQKYHEWIKRIDVENMHNGHVPKEHWITDIEKENILNYAQNHPSIGYRKLRYMMIDENIAFTSETSVFRILRDAGLLNRWGERIIHEKGFIQPTYIHQHWHTDISYIKIQTVFYFLISVLDGFSRSILSWDICESMTETDVEIVIQRAREKFPDARPQIISDNGSQYIAKDFKKFISYANFTHVRCRPNHPQSNGKMERFHRSYRTEKVRKSSFLSLADGKKQTAEYIEYYNNVRLHAGIFYLTPNDMLMGLKETRLEERRVKIAKAIEVRKESNRSQNRQTA
jgi:transposase InsO family protein